MPSIKINEVVRREMIKKSVWGPFLSYRKELRKKGLTLKEASHLAMMKVYPQGVARAYEGGSEMAESITKRIDAGEIEVPELPDLPGAKVPSSNEKNLKQYQKKAEVEELKKEKDPLVVAEEKLAKAGGPPEKMIEEAQTDVFAGKDAQATTLEEYSWVKNNCARKGISPKDAPSPGAWALMECYLTDDSFKTKFWSTWSDLAKLMAKKQMDEAPKSVDERLDRPILNILDVQERLRKSDLES